MSISATLSPAAVLGNYDISYNTASFDITKKAASVTPAAAGKIYGAADPALSGALSGFLAGDGVVASYSRTAGETVGAYVISATLSPASVLGNYDITATTASFDIAKKAASVTPAAAGKIYGAVDPALTGTLSGFLASDNVTATYSRTTGETVAGGPYTVSATLAPVGVLGNYDVTYNTATFSINRKGASVTPTAAGKIYGAVDPALTGTLSGFLASDNVTATYSRATGETVAGGPYTVSATLAPTGVLGNYDITYNTATFLIAKATPIVNVTGGTFTYDAAAHSATGSVTGVGGVSLGIPTFSYTPGGLNAPVNPGTYAVVATYSGSANYAATTTTAEIQIGYGTCSAAVGSGKVILQPINSDGTSVYNRKGGSTIPVKFRVCDAAGRPISNAAAVFAGTGGALTMLSSVRGTVTDAPKAE